jgi:hypothetical protein
VVEELAVAIDQGAENASHMVSIPPEKGTTWLATHRASLLRHFLELAADSSRVRSPRNRPIAKLPLSRNRNSCTPSRAPGERVDAKIKDGGWRTSKVKSTADERRPNDTDATKKPTIREVIWK